jgi:hypothetical protein
MKALFEITLRSPLPVISLVTAAAATIRGVAFQESAVAGVAELADGSKPFAGFITRNSQVGGPALGDVIYPGRLELPFPTGDVGSFENAAMFEVEGGTFVDAGITGATPLKTPLSFLAGKVCAAIANQYVQFMLVEQQVPAVPGNVRIRAISIATYLHA